MTMRRLLVAALLSAPPAAASAEAVVYKDRSAPVDARVEDLLARMTLDEKVSLLSGADAMSLPAIARLGIPPLKMTDGPLGVRFDKATAFPAGIALGASFDPDLVARVAAAMGDEALALGRDMLLGPCVNIARTPLGGRNFESFGEDPHLAARMAAAYVAGLQGRKVLASVKHFALNNQETGRMTIDVRAAERAEREIYLPAFEAAVRAGAWTVMAAYNKINGFHASENEILLNDVLKTGWGFQGFVVSDWGATHSTVPAANAGLDVEMPSGEFFGGGKLQAAVRDGRLPLSVVDDKARRVLRAMIGGGVFDRRDSERPSRDVIGSSEHLALAREAATEGLVLLKNDGALPIVAEGLKTLAVIGPLADVDARGGGSSYVSPIKEPVTVLAGLREALSGGAAVSYARGVALPGVLDAFDPSWLRPPWLHGKGPGLYGEYFANRELRGKPAFARVDRTIDFDWGLNGPGGGLGTENYSARWTGSLRVPRTGDYELGERSDDGARLWIDGALVIDHWTDHGPEARTKTLRLKAGSSYKVRLEYYQHGGGASLQFGLVPSAELDLERAVAAARAADAAIVVVGVGPEFEGEGDDRASLALPAGQDELIEAVETVNKNVVVVIEAGSPVLMNRWLGKVRAVVMAWYPGQEAGRAIADVLLGRANPSGKLPITFPRRWEDSPAYGHYPGKDGAVDYAEGIFVGYRGFDKRGIAPLFPFGYGLSYTRFAYSKLAVRARSASAASPDVAVSFDVKNTGSRAGAEVAQLYVRARTPGPGNPEQELKGFARVALAPGETKRVTLRLARDAFARYDESAHGWAQPAGRFVLRVGASSRDARLTGAVELR
jgi:beta-glucosidase